MGLQRPTGSEQEGFSWSTYWQSPLEIIRTLDKDSVPGSIVNRAINHLASTFPSWATGGAAVHVRAVQNKTETRVHTAKLEQQCKPTQRELSPRAPDVLKAIGEP